MRRVIRGLKGLICIGSGAVSIHGNAMRGSAYAYEGNWSGEVSDQWNEYDNQSWENAMWAQDWQEWNEAMAFQRQGGRPMRRGGPARQQGGGQRPP